MSGWQARLTAGQPILEPQLAVVEEKSKTGALKRRKILAHPPVECMTRKE